MIAAGNVAAADRTVEQHVADMGKAHFITEIHHAAGRMAGAMQDVEGQLADRDLIASLSQRSGSKSRTPVMPNRAPLITTLSSRNLSVLCGPSIGAFSASRSSAAPPTWSMWPWVSQIFSTLTLDCLIAA